MAGQRLSVVALPFCAGGRSGAEFLQTNILKLGLLGLAQQVPRGFMTTDFTVSLSRQVDRLIRQKLPGAKKETGKKRGKQRTDLFRLFWVACASEAVFRKNKSEAPRVS